MRAEIKKINDSIDLMGFLPEAEDAGNDYARPIDLVVWNPASAINVRLAFTVDEAETLVTALVDLLTMRFDAEKALTQIDLELVVGQSAEEATRELLASLPKTAANDDDEEKP